MFCHLSHRIPWEKLSEIVIVSENDGFFSVSIADEKAEQHFASKMFESIVEFAKTNQVGKDGRQEFDLSKWDGGVYHDGGGHLGVVDSIVSMYVVINLLLCNFEKFHRIVDPDHWLFRCCRGDFIDGCHPEWIALLCQSFITADQKDFKEFNGDTLQSMKEYAKVLFKCMYYHVADGNKGDISAYCIVGNIRWSLLRTHAPARFL